MLLLLQLLNMAVNLILSFSMGVFIVVGFVFFLIGFHDAKFSELIKGKDARRDLIKIFSTLGILLVILLISFESARTTGILAFTSELAPESARQNGMKLLILGIFQAVWLLISLKWLLPLVFNPVELNKKQTLVVISAPLLNLLCGLLTLQRFELF
ncbi:hypothetical protein [Paenibacillus azoreducens]|uniref:Uncharacterized protein n=1 Tax=Paenibacillus azoreducens TaxID=116718 RepID=A0A920CPG6_9BACL|nr:hypothetical protein [Paenibacillus azoreducens]GIO48656.1 hypothetical protein J34TS1_34210 [Paenibacillus azoreducens]